MLRRMFSHSVTFCVGVAKLGSMFSPVGGVQSMNYVSSEVKAALRTIPPASCKSLRLA